MRLVLSLFAALVTALVLPASVAAQAQPCVWVINPPGTSGQVSLSCVVIPQPQASAADVAAKAGVVGPLWADGAGGVRAVKLGPGIALTYTASGPVLDAVIKPVPCTPVKDATGNPQPTLFVQFGGGCLPVMIVQPGTAALAATTNQVIDKSGLGPLFVLSGVK